MKVWNEFEIKILSEYNYLYLKTDVYLLAVVFEELRNKGIEYHGLDPSQYFSSPGLIWDLMIKMKDVKLDFVLDTGMYQFIAKCTRGGVSYAVQRYSNANNKYVKSFDNNKLFFFKQKFILFFISF